MNRRWIPRVLRSFDWYHTFSGLKHCRKFLKAQTPGGDVIVRWYHERQFTVEWGDGSIRWFSNVEQVRDHLTDIGL